MLWKSSASKGTCRWVGTKSLGQENGLLRENEYVCFVQLLRPYVMALGSERMEGYTGTCFPSLTSTGVLPSCLPPVLLRSQDISTAMFLGKPPEDLSGPLVC